METFINLKNGHIYSKRNRAKKELTQKICSYQNKHIFLETDMIYSINGIQGSTLLLLMIKMR